MLSEVSHRRTQSLTSTAPVKRPVQASIKGQGKITSLTGGMASVEGDEEKTKILRVSSGAVLKDSGRLNVGMVEVAASMGTLQLHEMETLAGEQGHEVQTSIRTVLQDDHCLDEDEKKLVDGVTALMGKETGQPKDGEAQEDEPENLAAGSKEDDHCKVCLEWVYYLADITEKNSLSIEIPSMLVAMSQGCVYCSFVHKCIITLFPDMFSNSELNLRINTHHGKLFFYLYGGGMLRKNLEVFSVGYGDMVLEVPLVRVRSEDIPSYRDEVGGYEIDRLHSPPIEIAVSSVLPQGTDSDQTLLTICNWVNDCEENHDETCGSRLSSLLQIPKRILHVTETHVRLIDYPEEHSLYVCLSHCWGMVQVATTTSETINTHKSEIPLESLTQTFKDAIDICRRLGIEHMWIGSLCIVQDSQEDWEEESAKMAGIYAGAHFTIAASKSKDGNGGCYAAVDPECIGVEVPDTGACVRVMTPTFDETYGEDSEWPLLKRGWVYQELRMSRRVIHFGSQEVVWQCRKGRRSESGLNDRKISILSREAYLPSQSKYPAPKGELFERWHNTVANYSNRDLTYAKDKLPALAALTLEELLDRKDNFLAGLWKSTLINDLGWHARDAEDRPETLLGPTWSWITVDSEISYTCEYNGFIPVLEVKNHQYRIEGPEHMPTILTASLTVIAPLFPVTYKGDRKLAMEVMMLPSNAYAIASVSPDYKFETPGKYHIPIGQELYLAIMGIERYFMGRGFRCLLLHKCSRGEEHNSDYGRDGFQVFNRVGYAEIRDVEIFRAMRNDQYVYPGDKPLWPLVKEIWDYQRQPFVLI